ncbi:MAG: hypothetical protein ABF337_07345 [Akkermansiaceae bacterium]
MSWSDIFPIMDDEMVKSYCAEATEKERSILDQYFSIEEKYNMRESKHVVATSLFWKPASDDEVSYPLPSREVMKAPEEYGLSSRFKNPWKHYVEPIFGAAKHLAQIRPDLVYRVYLANDLEFLIPELTGAGCEVYLMKSSSILHNPGAMWRFLAMEEDGLVTMNDSDRAEYLIHDIERTELVAEGGLCYWRCPYFWQTTECQDLGMPGGYHASDAALMGMAKPLPVKLLLEAFIWNCQKRRIPNYCQVGPRRVPILGSSWPGFGFDEFFLNTVIHPRAAFDGVLTFVNWKKHEMNQWLALDIEYCTWANPKSELMFWGDPEEISEGEDGKVIPLKKEVQE